MRLCIYGGSFNPPHLGHVAAVRAAQRALPLDEVRLMPAAIPPHKQLAAGSPPPNLNEQTRSRPSPMRYSKSAAWRMTFLTDEATSTIGSNGTPASS